MTGGSSRGLRSKKVGDTIMREAGYNPRFLENFK
jgi:hypothetical protein